MKNFKRTHYSVVGTSALKAQHEERLIDFSHLKASKGKHAIEKPFFRTLISKIMQSKDVQSLIHGSLKGKSFNKATKLQTFAMGMCFFIFSIAFVYFGN